VNVPSLQFLGFVAVAALLLGISPKLAWRRGVLLGANVAFLLSFAHDPRRIGPFLCLLALGFAIVKALEGRKNGVAFAASLAALLLGFFVLKQYAFVPHPLILPFVYATVGMSYVFFRILALAIDTYQGSLDERVSLVSYVNYTLNFACLVSGPIQLYADYRRTEIEPAPLDAPIAWRAVERIVLGFFKVAALSPLFGRLQDVALAGVVPGLSFADRTAHAALLLIVFPLYLYVNFSGYCDVVIGAARFLRLELPENFDRPFRARGFIELWSRWHITLSHWLKTYVYSPLFLALMRRFPSREAEPWFGVGAYFVTFFIIGLWHGQTATFAFFGVLLGLGVSVNKGYQIVATRRLGRSGYRALCGQPVYASLSRGLTFFWFAFSVLWFWSSWSELGRVAATLGTGAVVLGCLGTVAVAAPVLFTLDALAAHLAAPRMLARRIVASPYLRTAFATTLAVTVVSVEILLRAPAPHIVYRGF